ncbi:AfsR/SARP family transcriptional regulator [Nakamurella lactea]|uniref:AfsR/SARP family transcriptional regulator n=1 Tax=Nakamurella lactea TaxID=459515 RepID=UPI00040EA3EF|nr:BTAD domain-containing putative transcriptional regulator [Nakamurella lactea]
MRIRDLGPITVEVDGETTLLGRRPEAALAALLVNTNQRVAVDTLLDAVWGDSGRAGSQSTLESHIWRIRQVLEPDRPRGAPSTVLVNDANGYRLVLASDEAESASFVHLADQARMLLDTDPQRAVRRCDEALALWRGPPYGASADASWAAAAVARLVETRNQLRIRRVDGLLAGGDLNLAVIDSGVLVRELPLREEVWAQRMLALYRSGRPDEALRAFRDARELLLDELGLEPGTELQQLQQRMLSRDAALDRPPATVAPATQAVANLPRRLSALIGRSTELASLVKLVERHPLITVVGAAGCGKTRLAIEVARDTAEQFPDGVWLVDLTAIEQPDIVVDLVASTIGLSPAATGPVASQLREYTRDRRMLLVFDNCEHVAPIIYDLLGDLLGDDSAVHVLATSREPISVPGEITWPLQPLTVPAESEPGSSSALELFLTRVHEADPTAELDEAQLQLAADVCDAVDGLPLALELAAARVRTASLIEIAGQVRADPGGLARVGGRGGRADHRRTIRDVIDGSHRLLGSEEQILHRRLSVLRGPFTRGCAAAVAGFAPLSPADIPTLLDSLAHKSLVSATRATDPDEESTFRQLATVRSHAETELLAAGEVSDAVASRHRWLRAMLDRRPQVGRADDHGWYRSLDHDFGTVRASLQSVLVDRPDPSAGFTLSRISNFWYYRGRMVEALHWLELAVPPPPDTDPLDAAMTELSLAGLHGMRGRFDLARPLFDHALAELGTIPTARRADVIEHLASLALVGALHQDFGLVAVLGERIKAIAAGGSTDFELMAEAVACFATIATTPPERSAERAGDIYQRALAGGVLLAGWICCIVRTSLAVPLRDPADGLVWTDRMTDVQVRLGARLEAMPIEGRAALMVASGDHREGVALFAASQAQSRRAGIGWPTRPTTEDQLDSARQLLGPTDYELAWREGLTMTPTHALGQTRTR